MAQQLSTSASSTWASHRGSVPVVRVVRCQRLSALSYGPHRHFQNSSRCSPTPRRHQLCSSGGAADAVVVSSSTLPTQTDESGTPVQAPHIESNGVPAPTHEATTAASGNGKLHHALQPAITLHTSHSMPSVAPSQGPVAEAASTAAPAPVTAQPSTSSSSSRSSQPASQMPSTPEQPGLFPKVRAVLFFMWSMLLAVPLFISMAFMSPVVLNVDKYRRLVLHWVNNLWAKCSTALFYSVEIEGRENLPPPERAVVYVANHQSFLDIYSLFHLNRPFKFISKTSNFMIPVIGWSMFLTGHVKLDRVDRRSQLECLKACRELLERGAPVLFFPEGTRSRSGVMAGFKKGAFSVACKTGVDVVPITLIGTGQLMPSGSESQLYPGRVRIVVHAPIPTRGRDAGQVCAEARAAVAGALPPELHGSDTDVGEGAIE